MPDLTLMCLKCQMAALHSNPSNFRQWQALDTRWISGWNLDLNESKIVRSTNETWSHLASFTGVWCMSCFGALRTCVLLDCNLFLGYGDCGGWMNEPFSYVTEEKTAAELAAISHGHSFVLVDISTVQHTNNKLESTQKIVLYMLFTMKKWSKNEDLRSVSRHRCPNSQSILSPVALFS